MPIAIDDLQLQPSNPSLSFPWTEFISNRGSAWDMSAGHDGMTVAMNMVIESDDMETALKEILGYSERGTPKTFDLNFPSPLSPGIVATSVTLADLNRRLPMRHPRMSHLWCTRIAKVQGIKPNGQIVGPYGRTGLQKFLLLTLQFTRPNYSLYKDNEVSTFTAGIPATTIRNEWERYTDRFWKPSVQMLTRRGTDQFHFVEGHQPDGGFAGWVAGTGGAATKEPIPGPVGTKISKAKLERTWYQIPQNCIYNADGFPEKYLSPYGGYTPIGTVNSQTIFGCPPETLLLEGIDITPTPLPFPAEIIGLPGLPGVSASEIFCNQFNITFHFEYFNPPRGYLRDNLGSINGFVTTVGHNCLPWAKDNKWYRVASKGVTTVGYPRGIPMFELYPFSLLFTCI